MRGGTSSLHDGTINTRYAQLPYIVFQTFVRFIHNPITIYSLKRSKGAITMNRLDDLLTSERNQRLRNEARNERLAQEAQRRNQPASRNLLQRLTNRRNQPERSQH